MVLASARAFAKPVGDERRTLASRVVPIVKSVDWLEEETPALQGSRDDYLQEPLNDQLVVVYASNESPRSRYLTARDAAMLRLDRGQLRALAAENLKRCVPPLRLEQGRAVMMVVAGGDYEASLLAAPDLWSSSVMPDGDLVVAIPARDLLLVTGTRTPDGIAQLRDAASRLYPDASDRITPELFVLRDGKFSKLE